MTDTNRLFGCGTALVTPFTATGEVDEPAIRALVDWQIEQGVHFLVPCGSTGEAATLTPAEHRRVVEVVVEQTRGRVPVMAGAGSNDTKKAIALSREMKDAGATHLLHVSPMYNKPPQRGIIAHFKAIAEAVELPIVVYNVPGRTGSNIETKTTLTLAQVPGIVGVKEASGNLSQIMDIIRERPPHFSVLSGDDGFTLAVMAAGGDGIISVISNATPRAVVRLVENARDGDFEGARNIHECLTPWMHAAFIESNPLPVKAALAMMGRIKNVLRLPLVPMMDTHESVLRSALQRAGTIQ
ncbi:MAG TPA: 4-hydroxy-tetrahydrodipicolinate synthase [Gemmatimonadaceae bacterium]|nr:4-hydroxy-tetrahydrodipicolinate synthase [Gemmatimonadaceae bacterium]